MNGIREFGESAVNAVLDRVGRGVGRMQERKPLPYDLLESDDEYLVVFDAPGAAPSDVQVRFIEDRVEVRIDRFREFFEAFEMRFPGRGLSLNGAVALPTDAVDARSATATLSGNGTLHVRVPKDEDVTDVEVTDGDDVSGVDVSGNDSDDDLDDLDDLDESGL